MLKCQQVLPATIFAPPIQMSASGNTQIHSKLLQLVVLTSQIPSEGLGQYSKPPTDCCNVVPLHHVLCITHVSRFWGHFVIVHYYVGLMQTILIRQKICKYSKVYSLYLIFPIWHMENLILERPSSKCYKPTISLRKRC